MRIVAALSGNPLSISKTVNNLSRQIQPFDQIYYSTSLDIYDVPEGVKLYKLPDSYQGLDGLAGVLLEESDPETLIVVIETDVVYPISLVRDLYLNHLKHPQAALGSCGWRVGAFPFYLSGNFNRHPNNHWFNLNHGSRVDFLGITPGLLVQRSMFPVGNQLNSFFASYLKTTRNMKQHADVYLSAYLCSRHIERILVRCDAITIAPTGRAPVHEMYPSLGFIKSIHEAQELKLLTRFEQISVMGTITGPFIVFSVFMVMLLMFVVMILR